MNSKKLFFAMLGAIVLLGVMFVAAVVLGNSILQKESNKLVQLKLTSQLLDEQQSALTQAQKDIQTYSDLDSIARSVVPQDKDQAQTVREIYKIAQQSNIKLSSISFPSSTLGQISALPTAAASSSAAKTPSAASSLTQVSPVVGIPGVYTMEVTIQQDSNNPTSYQDFIHFLSALENNRRTANVTSVNVSPLPQDRSQITFNLIANVYIKP